MAGVSTSADLFIVNAHAVSLVELECSETKLYVSRSSKGPRLNSVPLELRGDASQGDEMDVLLPPGVSMAPSCSASLSFLIIFQVWE